MLGLPKMANTFMGCPTACVRSESDENGASLKATRQYQTFNCDILVWSHSNSYMLQSYGHT